MCKEIERCRAAIELAQAGHNVALISSGDAGIYGMAGLVLELVNKQQLDIEVRLIPRDDGQYRRRLAARRAADA